MLLHIKIQRNNFALHTCTQGLQSTPVTKFITPPASVS